MMNHQYRYPSNCWHSSTVRSPKWWMPDDVAFVPEIPHTATGKIQKITLREQFKDFVLPTAAAAPA
jgi:acyl-CoA synthetase (AMP-forming)/AMP-acid ligase II